MQPLLCYITYIYSLFGLSLLQIVICSQYEDCGYQSSFFDCPGTAVNRIAPIHAHLSEIDMNEVSWATLRMDLVAICGLKQDNTGTSHCFADWTHVDCCPIITSHASNTNQHSRIYGMHAINQLGPHIVQHSNPIGSDNNGSWCTCSHGAPLDVCHLQFGSMIAFKLIWCPDQTATNFIALVIDNDGNLINYGMPQNQPNTQIKLANWNIVTSSKDSAFKADMTALCSATWQTYYNKQEL